MRPPIQAGMIIKSRNQPQIKSMELEFGATKLLPDIRSAKSNRVIDLQRVVAGGGDADFQ